MQLSQNLCYTTAMIHDKLMPAALLGASPVPLNSQVLTAAINILSNESGATTCKVVVQDEHSQQWKDNVFLFGTVGFLQTGTVYL